jgi:hypothetical protein
LYAQAKPSHLACLAGHGEKLFFSLRIAKIWLK